MQQNGTTFYLPKSLIPLIDKIQRDRADPTRSDTVRFLILRAMSEMSYLPPEQKKALGIAK